MKAMGEHTRINPANRIKRLESGFMQRLISSPVAKGELAEWNIKFDPKLVTVPGRVIDPERIIMGRNVVIQLDHQADFTRQLKGKTMIHATAISSWVCIYPAKEELSDDHPAAYASAIERTFNRYQPILILCVLMNNKADKYEAVKKKCCVDRAIPSQCVLAKNLAHRNADSICTKIAIQINCKLGGTPWGASFPFKVSVFRFWFSRIFPQE
ncbi:unnamed protein product [Nesidiocoris tenuis]|uniref:Piwi domain-containing protein n=1 Tax=Nesidiocoris tenuis TaxID=355587 RepID=A0A6H5GBA4_9HEMI|nr:unnamed protein product [Nesidiocoris tenuis]